METKGNSVSYYPPQGDYKTFESEDDYAVRGRNWGLFGKAPKKQFLHKNKSTQSLITIKGYQDYGNLNILIVAFENGNLSCIHSSYLKEMQSSNFGKEIISEELEEVSAEIMGPDAEKIEDPVTVVSVVIDPVDVYPVTMDQVKVDPVPVKVEKTVEKAPKTQKEKKAKIELPVEKVKFTAKVKEFATKANPFSDTDDEVILFEDVVVMSDVPLVIGDAWCGYSNTLKAIGLEIADIIEFEGKVVDKKFNKEIVYKLNNPSKITKQN
jgi:hypothetical protein